MQRETLLEAITRVIPSSCYCRTSPKLSGTTHNVFGIQVGVGITIAVKVSQNSKENLYYYRVPEFRRKTEKLAFLKDKKSISSIEWQELLPDNRYTWLTEKMYTEFDSFLPLGTKDAKASKGLGPSTIFNTYSSGVKTNRDNWAYDFDHTSLRTKILRLIESYNGEVDRWKRRGSNSVSVDDFVDYDDRQIKWSGDLKMQLTKGKYATYSETNIRLSLYRPFTKQYLYFDSLLNNSIYL